MSEMQVTLLDVMGDDDSVCDAARVSFAKTADNYTPEQNAKLIRYLAKHNHWTPFGHCFASFRIKAPIFVARQLGKHQVGLVWNEVSRRYVDDEPEFYVPETWRKRAENVKQGSGYGRIDSILSSVGWYKDWPVSDTTNCPIEKHIRTGDCEEVETNAAYKYAMVPLLHLYLDLIDAGICPEQARMVLPQSMMTEWVWSGSLAAFARVCKLRLDPHTQYETRLIAKEINSALQSYFPISWKALTEHC